MRIRKLAVLYCLLSVAVMFLFYTMLSSYRESGNESIVGTGNVDIDFQIKAKIKGIEGDIQRNKQTIRLIRRAIGDIIKGRDANMNLDYLIDRLRKLEQLIGSDVNDGSLVDSVVGLEAAQRKSVRLLSEMCPAKPKPIAPFNITMMDLYSKLEFDNPNGGVWKQGFPISYSGDYFSKRKLKVIVMPHSHQDPGWIKTYEEYFDSQSRLVLDSMLRKLQEHPDLKFVYAEIAFFSKWWDTLSDSNKEAVKKLVINGQLEIVSGGWVMTDEANAHYHAMVDQLIEGQMWLKDNLDIKPSASWSIDPFGQSSTMAYLVRKMGIKHMVIQRIHYSIKKYLAQTKQLEFNWGQQWDATGQWDSFCHMMPFYSYDVPHSCGPEPALCCQFDFQRLPGSSMTCPWNIPPKPITEANLQERAEALLDQYRKKATLYRHNVVLIPLGDDFRYMSDTEWDKQYLNYKKLMDYMNSKELNVEISFGTLKDYFAAVESRSDVYSKTHLPSPGLPRGYPRLAGDFFTYADRDKDYWSGYFTSRPFFKRMDRVVEAQLRSAEIAFSLLLVQWRALETSSVAPPLNFQPLMDKLKVARRNMGLFQHHDGVTGTAKTHVMEDYGNKMQMAITFSRSVLASSLMHLLSKDKHHAFDDSVVEIDASQDSLTAPQTIHVTKENPRHLILFNSLAQPRQSIVTVEVNSPLVVVKNSGNQNMPIQIDPVFQEDTISTTRYLLRIPAELGPLAAETYTISTSESLGETKLSQIVVYNLESSVHDHPHFNVIKKPAEQFTLDNSYTKLTFDKSSAMVQEYLNKATSKTSPLSIEFVQYKAERRKEMSGAYLFLPDGDATPITYSKPKTRVVKGPFVQSAEIFLPNVIHKIHLYNSPGIDSSGFEIVNTVDIRSTSNTELAMRFKTDINNKDSEFFTDLNCFQFVRRKRWSKLPLQANVYPMPCAAFLEGSTPLIGSASGALLRLSLLSGQPLGVASMAGGQLEVFLDRRLDQDDNRGLQQPVRDNKVTLDTFRVALEILQQTSESPDDINFLSGSAQLSLNDLLHPVNRLSMTPSFSSTSSQILSRLSLMTGLGLPCDYHLVNLRTQEKDVSRPALILHRYKLHCGAPHIPGTSCKLNPGGRVSLISLFNEIVVAKATKTSLTLMHELGEVSAAQLVVNPMELDTFKLEFK